MKTQKIFSKNADWQRLVVLKTNRCKRQKNRAFFVEGVRSINNAVACGWQIESFVYSFEAQLSSWAKDLLRSVQTSVNYALTDALMAELSGKADTSELIAVAVMREDAAEGLTLSANPVLALFDRPSNHGNLGTIIRSCDALGVEALLLTGHSADLYEPEVIAASMGSFFKLPVIRIAENETLLQFLAALREKYPDFQIVGTTAHRENSIYHADLRRPTLFLIGNETQGLSKAYRELCDLMVTIPMAEDSYATSFNVGCAATVMFYEARRQREKDIGMRQNEERLQ